MDYVVHRKEDNKSVWAFNIYEGKLQEIEKYAESRLVVKCDYQTSHEIVFRIPTDYLRKNILDKAKLDRRGRYLFEVSKQSYDFNWHLGIPMNGRKFLKKG